MLVSWRDWNKRLERDERNEDRVDGLSERPVCSRGCKYVDRIEGLFIDVYEMRIPIWDEHKIPLALSCHSTHFSLPLSQPSPPSTTTSSPVTPAHRLRRRDHFLRRIRRSTIPDNPTSQLSSMLGAWYSQAQVTNPPTIFHAALEETFSLISLTDTLFCPPLHLSWPRELY